ncbi:scavenger receptor cysteine-rich domain-containing protein DMBT1-like isoform X3 [Cetorhinus maximus]
MTIYFRSDSSVTRRGFAANYSSLPNNDETFTTPTSGGTCGGYLDTAYGSVNSPNYPYPYPNDAQCTWYIRGGRTQVIKLQFTYVELEYTSGCSYDYIAIYDGPSTNSVLLSKFCNGSDEIFTSSSSSMTIYFRSDSSVTRRGFAANYSSLPNNDGGSCGGYLDAAYGSILSPNYPYPYPNNAQCSWYIRGDRNHIIKLQFTYVELEYTSTCSYDYIAIYDGPTTNSVLLSKFCNGSDEIFISSSNSMTIYFRSDSSVTRRGFAANYSSLPNNDGGSCGGYLDAAYGSIFSPNYPYPYPNSAQCSWYIRGDRNQIIKLQFTYVELEYTSTCSYDYIAIYDGPTTNSVLLSKFCNGSDEIFISSSNSMTIYFRSDSSVTRRGFAANYSSLPNNDGGSCGGYLDAAYGSIFSPNYPYPYPNSAQCSWYIRGDRNQIIKLQFTYVELEYTSTCSYDYIAIYDGPTTNSVLLSKFCNGSDEIFISSSNSMTIYFRSDSSVTRRGFAANYSSLPNNDGGSCGGYLDAAYGSIFSPNYPYPYPNSAQCSWYIRGDRNQIIKLQFTYVELEYTSTCSYDYIAIYDGPTTNSVLLSKFCNGSDEIFISSSNSMTIYFRSDSSVTRRGFAANYSSLPNNDGGSCGGYLDAAYGSIFSPNYPYPYPNSAQCSWYIRGDRNQIIKLQFTYVELEYTSTCSYDYIAIYDGPTTNSVLLSKFCNGSDEIFISSSNSMTIYFRSDSSVTRRGFAANYSSLPNNDGGSCGGYLDAAYGSIFSPNYPYPYPNSAQCSWYIRGDRNQIIKLQFTYVELEYTSTCSYDYIAIYDGPTTNSVLLSKFCNGSDEIFISSSNSMTIYFRSDSSVTRRGFAANYSSLPNNDGGSCGGYLDAAYGSIFSPNYPYPYPNSAQCSWYIRGDRNQIIKLQFTYVELEYTSTCSYDYIAIYDGPTTNSVLLSKFCNGSDEIFISSSNSMTIYFRSDSSVTRRGFAANYSSLPNNDGGSCGGYLDAAYGSIFSPNYPYPYPNSAQCSWYIRGDRNQIIKLQFTYVELEYTSACSYDYIAIYDGPSTNSVLLSKFCHGSNQKFISSSNSMTVYFRSDSSVTRRGFTASFYALPNNDDFLTCSTDYMEAKLSRSYLQLLGFNIHSLYLNDRNCRPTITANDVVFKIPLNRCGTESQGNNGSIIYSNTIRSSPSDTIITRESNLQFNIGCEMQQDTMFKITYVTNENMTGDIVENVTESGTFNVSMTFYDSPSFTRPVLASPYYVDLRQNLFLQANLHSSDTHLVVFVDTCTASPYNFDWTSRTYDLIKNGCVRDGTYVTFPSPANGVARFKFSAFKFLNLHSSVYLQCKFVVCKAYDYSSRCYRGCISRQKRATSSSTGSTNVQIGPIELKKDLEYYEGRGLDKEVDEADETTIQSSFPFVLSLLVLVVVVSVLVAMVLKLYNNK